MSIYLLNSDTFRSASAFSAIFNPSNPECQWGQKAFTGYLNGGQEEGRANDATELIKKVKGKDIHILADYVSPTDSPLRVHRRRLMPLRRIRKRATRISSTSKSNFSQKTSSLPRKRQASTSTRCIYGLIQDMITATISSPRSRQNTSNVSSFPRSDEWLSCPNLPCSAHVFTLQIMQNSFTRSRLLLCS